MSNLPKIGEKHETTFVVSDDHTVSLTGLPPVLSTPGMIWELEYAALHLMTPRLPEGVITVGARVDVEHLAPALPGDTVRCIATVVHAEGNDVTFRVEAHGPKGLLGQGVHRRKIVPVTALLKRLQRAAPA